MAQPVTAALAAPRNRRSPVVDATSATLAGAVNADGGFGAYGPNGSGKAGNATADLHLTGATEVIGDATADGGDGKGAAGAATALASSHSTGDGRASATALAVGGTGWTSAGTATATADADGGSGTISVEAVSVLKPGADPAIDHHHHGARRGQRGWPNRRSRGNKVRRRRSRLSVHRRDGRLRRRPLGRRLQCGAERRSRDRERVRAESRHLRPWRARRRQCPCQHGFGIDDKQRRARSQ